MKNEYDVRSLKTDDDDDDDDDIIHDEDDDSDDDGVDDDNQNNDDDGDDKHDDHDDDDDKQEVNSTYEPRSSREETSTTNRNYLTTTTTSIITNLDGQNDNTKHINDDDNNNNNNNNIVLPVVVVVIAIIIIIVVVVSLVIICKRSHKTTSERQQDITEPNIYSVPPVIPSAPSLDIIYDSYSENIRVQGTIHDPECHTEDDILARTNTDIRTQDEHDYTSLTQTSGVREANGHDNPTFRTQDDMSPVTPSGSGNENKYAAVNKPRRDPTEVELHDNPNYEAPNSA
ncbi:hypothetical protein LSH36_150g07013 [Paralvinella palmiformis]|uniref:Uncharacterized protein n=1 Tax=Paralvinella palmiformis TaxID=53620 RepID=A0AAD9JW92_9ANNE|nr:hypothetical protein LSH36_150g07013 [Paralvinella palmiformis]